MDYRRTRPEQLLWGLVLYACGSSVTNPYGSGANTATNAGNAAGAAGTAATAAVVWAAGGGCRLQGCPYGSYCDTKSGLCKSQTCTEGEGCPPGTVCNEGLDRCQEAPPPNTPNDFLPQDDATHPPGMN